MASVGDDERETEQIAEQKRRILWAGYLLVKFKLRSCHTTCVAGLLESWARRFLIVGTNGELEIFRPANPSSRRPLAEGGQCPDLMAFYAVKPFSSADLAQYGLKSTTFFTPTSVESHFVKANQIILMVTQICCSSYLALREPTFVCKSRRPFRPAAIG
jgi:hypothetical protein